LQSSEQRLAVKMTQKATRIGRVTLFLSASTSVRLSVCLSNIASAVLQVIRRCQHRRVGKRPTHVVFLSPRRRPLSFAGLLMICGLFAYVRCQYRYTHSDWWSTNHALFLLCTGRGKHPEDDA